MDSLRPCKFVSANPAQQRIVQHKTPVSPALCDRIRRTRPHRVPQRRSFGQKRLLAFYWYLACIPDGIVIADELVNGFHHDWIKGCLEEIGDRQAILATQSPLLLDYLEFDNAEQVRKSFVLCSIDDSAEGGRKFKLRNPTEEEGARFMAAYDNGYQHVNAILSAMGMW